MAEAQIASFNFEKFVIPKFSYDESKKPEVTLNLDFDINGKYHTNDGRFEIELDVTGKDNDGSEKVVFFVRCIATFKFDNNAPLSDIPVYFYRNATAIVFPYIRSFISTLTLQANTGLIILGLMNLSRLEKELINNTIEVKG